MLKSLRDRFRRTSTRAFRLDTPTIAEGGLAFLIAYVIAYATQLV